MEEVKEQAAPALLLCARCRAEIATIPAAPASASAPASLRKLLERCRAVMEIMARRPTPIVEREDTLKLLARVDAALAAPVVSAWTTDWSQIDPYKRYIIAAIASRADGTLYLSRFDSKAGWSVKQHMEGCYAAMLMPEFGPPAPPEPK